MMMLNVDEPRARYFNFFHRKLCTFCLLLLAVRRLSGMYDDDKISIDK